MPQIIVPQVRAHYTPGGVVYTIDNRLLLVDGEIPLALLGSYAEGSLIIGGATDWETLLEPGAAGYALVSDGTTFDWDQTPAWAGTHSFADGITLTGASGTNIITVPDNVAQAFNLVDAGGLEYLRIVSLDAQPIIDINSAATDIDFHVRANGHADAFQVRGVDGQITLGVLGAGFVQSDGGGVLSSAAIQVGDLPAHAAEHEVGGGDLVDHDALTNFVANEHISHAGVTLTAGAGLTGGGTIEASRSFAVGAGAGITVNANDVALTTPGTLTATTVNSSVGNHVHTIADTADGAANHNVILASGAAGELTMDDYFTVNGGTFGITGNELLTVNAAGTFAFSGITGVSVQNGDWIGAGAGTAWLYDSGNGDITSTADIGIKTTAPTASLSILDGAPALPSGFTAEMHIGDTNANSRILMGQDATHSLVLLWDFDVTPADAIARIETFGGNNDLILQLAGGNVGIGTISPSARLDVVESDAATITAPNVVVIGHNTSGTAAPLFGSTLHFELEDGVGNPGEPVADITAQWSSETAPESGLLRFNTYYNGAIKGGIATWSGPVDDNVTVVIPGGVGDVTRVFRGGFVVAKQGGVGGDGDIDSGALDGVEPGDGAQEIYNVGGDIVKLTVGAGGAVSVVRTDGAGTFDVVLFMILI